jgi:hypothetical protein
MSVTMVPSLTSRVRLGLARADITPPVGIYHRVWGAARHDQSTGVHRPLLGDVLAIGPADSEGPALLRAHLDLVSLAMPHQNDLVQALSRASGVPLDQTVVSHSHTHAAGWFSLDRVSFPGGDLIPGYLAEMRAKLEQASREAVRDMQEVFITYATGRCNMAANRDFWDEATTQYVCGLNPEGPADDTVVVARITDLSGKLLATIVNYACHATTLAWLNTLISPDYVGAMREEVTRSTGAPCIFAQGACGDLGPRYDYVGDTAIADQNGRWLGYAALSALESMGPLATDYEYKGPVVSGATLGVWETLPFSAERLERVSRFEGGRYAVDLPLKPKPDPVALQQKLEEWEAFQRDADARGDAIAARDYGAHAERARRWLSRIHLLPDGTTYPFHYTVHRMGDALWVTTGGEPYNLLQRELRRRFPDDAILLSPISGESGVAYLLARDSYGKGLYQEQSSILAAGCLETLIDAIADRIQTLP